MSEKIKSSIIKVLWLLLFLVIFFLPLELIMFNVIETGELPNHKIILGMSVIQFIYFYFIIVLLRGK